MENNDNNLSGRLRFALKILGVSQTELARRINTKPQVIQYLCAGNSEKSKFMFDIAEALKIDVTWLAIGRGEPPCSASLRKNEKTLPVLSFSQVKEWKVFNKDIDISKTVQIPVQNDIDENSFAVILNDQSMAPRFNADTILIIESNNELSKLDQNNRFVLVYLKKEDLIVFRQLEINNNSKIIFPLNKNLYKNITLTEKDIILGVCKEARWIT